MLKNYDSEKRHGHQSTRARTDKQKVSLPSSTKRWVSWLIEPGALHLCAGRQFLGNKHSPSRDMINMHLRDHQASLAAWISHQTASWTIGHTARHQDIAQANCIDRQCGVHCKVKLHPQPHNSNRGRRWNNFSACLHLHCPLDAGSVGTKHKASCLEEPFQPTLLTTAASKDYKSHGAFLA